MCKNCLQVSRIWNSNCTEWNQAFVHKGFPHGFVVVPWANALRTKLVWMVFVANEGKTTTLVGSCRLFHKHYFRSLRWPNGHSPVCGRLLPGLVCLQHGQFLLSMSNWSLNGTLQSSNIFRKMYVKIQGICPPNYRCNSNGFCCSSCPDNAMPFGTCTASDSASYNPQYTNGQRQLTCPQGESHVMVIFNSLMVAGYSCVPGDICCKNSIIL